MVWMDDFHKGFCLHNIIEMTLSALIGVGH